MPTKHRILLALVVALIAIAFSPLLVGQGVRAWIWWKARQEKLSVKIDKIEAPFLKPVVLRGVRVTSAPDAAFRVDLRADEASASLNMKTVLFRMRGRALKYLSVKNLRAEIHRNVSGEPFRENNWTTWQKLLPNSGKIDGIDLRLEDGATVALLRGASLSISDIEAGRCSADELTISSPILRQTFSRLRGATHWQGDRLTLAGLTLTHGIDAQSITADLSHLGKQRLGFEFDIDTFGGKLRGDISNEWRSQHSNWSIAASASDISLGQTSQALGLTDRVAGRMHAGKLTFRGDLHDPMNATGSLWTELTAPAWRDREADVIMIGAALYNRQIALQQLFVKQGKNELTLNGEAPIPNKLSDWLSPDFRGDISASINNLGDFVRLFGVAPEQFGGNIVVQGTINTRGKKLGGQISIEGKSLLFFHSPVDLLSAHLKLDGGVAEINDFYLKRGDDYARVEGKIDMAHDRHPVGAIDFYVGKISDYFPKSIFAGSLQGRLDIDDRDVSSDVLNFTDGAITVSFATTTDFADLQNIETTLAPLQALVDLSAPNASDCIDHIQVQPARKSKQPPPPIENIDLTADLVNGFREFQIKAGATTKSYRVLCTEPGNRPLPIGYQGTAVSKPPTN